MEKQLQRKFVKSQLMDDFYKCVTKIKVCKESIAARKEWLIQNSRCSEILDSEFYYQMLPSVDFCLYKIENSWLKER